MIFLGLRPLKKNGLAIGGYWIALNININMILFDHFLFQQHVNRNIFNVVVWKVDEEFALIEFDEVELTGGYVAGELIVTQIQEL